MKKYTRARHRLDSYLYSALPDKALGYIIIYSIMTPMISYIVINTKEYIWLIYLPVAIVLAVFDRVLAHEQILLRHNDIVEALTKKDPASHIDIISPTEVVIGKCDLPIYCDTKVPDDYDIQFRFMIFDTSLGVMLKYNPSSSSGYMMQFFQEQKEIVLRPHILYNKNNVHWVIPGLENTVLKEIRNVTFKKDNDNYYNVRLSMVTSERVYIKIYDMNNRAQIAYEGTISDDQWPVANGCKFGFRCHSTESAKIENVRLIRAYQY
jgi:hypothetical protein